MQKYRFYRLNQQIQAREVRLLNSRGIQIGIFLREAALKKAKDLGVDLVEIAPNAKPSVCKLIDFKKFLYQEGKKRKEERKKIHGFEIKEIRLGPFTSEHDLTVKIARAKEFLKGSHKVKVVIKFTGRQMAHPEFGHKTLQLFLGRISEISKIEAEPHFEGRLLIALVSPVKSGGKREDQSPKISSKEV